MLDIQQRLGKKVVEEVEVAPKNSEHRWFSPPDACFIRAMQQAGRFASLTAAAAAIVAYGYYPLAKARGLSVKEADNALILAAKGRKIKFSKSAGAQAELDDFIARIKASMTPGDPAPRAKTKAKAKAKAKAEVTPVAEVPVS